MDKKSLLFLCTGNSCRSQMAEGLASYLKLNKIFQIHSAGVEAHGLNKRAIEVMNEIGIDISHQESTSVSNNELLQYDLIITLCGDARDRCPILSNKNNHIHWGIEDPANAQGSKNDMLEVYRNVRDQILKNVKSLL